MATTSNNPNARYDAGPNAAGCGRVATQEQLQAQAETGLLGDSTLSGAAFRVGFNAAGIRNVNTGGNVAGSPEQPTVVNTVVPVVPFSYEPASALVTWTDTNGAGQLGDLATFNATADLLTVTAIDVGYQAITTLTVGNTLAALTSLTCYANLFTAIDLSGVPLLEYFDCGYGQLTSLDLSHTPNLQTVFCSGNQLTTLDCSGLSSLTTVNCQYNQLTSIAISDSSSLTALLAFDNNLDSTAVDSLLVAIDAFGTSGPGKSIDLSGTGNSAPGATGLTAKGNLTGRLWSVTTN